MLFFHCSKLSPLNFCSSERIVSEGIADIVSSSGGRCQWRNGVCSVPSGTVDGGAGVQCAGGRRVVVGAGEFYDVSDIVGGVSNIVGDSVVCQILSVCGM